MDQGQPKPPPPPQPALEESMRELTLEDGGPDPAPPPGSSPESTMMMDIDGGGAADSCRLQHGNGNGNVVVLPQQRSSHALPAVAAPGGGVGHGHEVLQLNTPATAGARGVEAILQEMLPEGSVLLAYTHNGYLFA